MWKANEDYCTEETSSLGSLSLSLSLSLSPFFFLCFYLFWLVFFFVRPFVFDSFALRFVGKLASPSSSTHTPTTRMLKGTGCFW